MRTASSLVVLALAASAYAQDDPAKKPAPTPPAPAEPAKPDAAPPAKKERKVDPEATKALDAYAALVHFPATAGWKSVTLKGDYEQNGMVFGINPKWTAESGFDFEVTVPSQVIEMAKAQGATEDMVTPQIKGQLGQLVAYSGVDAMFERPGKNWAHYDLAVKKDGDDRVVELTAFDDQADAAARTYVFDKTGLLKTTTKTPKASDPMAAQLGGMPLQVDWKFEKKGARYVLTERTIPIASITSHFAYFEDPSGAVLLKQTRLETPQGEHTIDFHDYVVDGKPFESTKSATPKSAAPSDGGAKPAAPSGDKPVDKPAEPPK